MKSVKNKHVGKTKDLKLSWITRDHGELWLDWQKHAAAWISIQTTAKTGKLAALDRFLCGYLIGNVEYAADVNVFFTGKSGHVSSTAEFLKVLSSLGTGRKEYLYKTNNYVVDFTNYVLAQIIPDAKRMGRCKLHSMNPMELKFLVSGGPKNGHRRNDLRLSWIVEDLGEEWSDWQKYAAEWMVGQTTEISNKLFVLNTLIGDYLFKRVSYASDVNLFFSGHANHIASSEEYLEVLKSHGGKDKGHLYRKNNLAVDFTCFVLEQITDNVESVGQVSLQEQNPLKSLFTGPRGRKNDGRGKDESLSWISKDHGSKWLEWQNLAASWISTQTSNKPSKLIALDRFISDYLVKRVGYASDLNLFFLGQVGHICSTEEFIDVLAREGVKNKNYRQQTVNKTVDFIDYVLEQLASNVDERGRPEFFAQNPFSPIRQYSKNVPRSSNDFLWLIKKHGQQWEEFRAYAEKWINLQKTGLATKVTILNRFFDAYLTKYAPYTADIDQFLTGYKGHKVSSEELIESLTLQAQLDENYCNTVVSQSSAFINFIIDQKYGRKSPRPQNPIITKKQRSTLSLTTDISYAWMTRIYGSEWSIWQAYATEWIKVQIIQNALKVGCLARFFNQYLIPNHPYTSDPLCLFKGENGHTISSQEFANTIELDHKKSESYCKRMINIAYDFIEYVRVTHYAKNNLVNPLVARRSRIIFKHGDQGFSFEWLTNLHGSKWKTWREVAGKWVNQQNGRKGKASHINLFFRHYLLLKAPYASDPRKLFTGDKGHKVSAEEFEHVAYVEFGKSREYSNIGLAAVHDFLDFVSASLYPLEGFVNPIQDRRKTKCIGTSYDLKLSWLTREHGEPWKHWEQHAADWMSKQEVGLSGRLQSLVYFFRRYLVKHVVYAHDLDLFFSGHNGHRVSSEELLALAVRNSRSQGGGIPPNAVNQIANFIDYIIETNYSFLDEYGVKRSSVSNPLIEVKSRVPRLGETVRTPLPYRYIEMLREILCPYRDKARASNPKEQNGKPWLKRNFKDWAWAINIDHNRWHWFEVDYDAIDVEDPDCVWREDYVCRKGTKQKIYKMWSPVAAVALFVKLHLPLRPYQVRFLDSGEADTWRYQSGTWIDNTKVLKKGKSRAPFARGVFNRTYDSALSDYSTGLYISTNKTADKNLPLEKRGYTIPWEHEELLYWLEKLRNWQEKFNPISRPVNAKDLNRVHFGDTKSKVQLEGMGDFCFLFRNPAGNLKHGADKPIIYSTVARIWYQLLKRLEDDLIATGQTMKDGTPLRFVKDYGPSYIRSKTATHFPLHNLRVSLITAYALYSSVPLPVISKLLAGHTRLLMTIYYTKISNSVMKQKMEDAEDEIKNRTQDSLESFLKDAELQEIESKCAFLHWTTIQTALDHRNPVPWERKPLGICLVGGNTSDINGVATVGGCWNGDYATDAQNEREFRPVPHGPENCVRCRWFITDASHLPVLNAQFNQLSYKAHMAASQANKIEQQLDLLKDEQYFAELEDKPFTKYEDLKSLSRRYESQRVEADEYAKDYIATFNIIERLIDLEKKRGEKDNSQKILALGTEEEIGAALKFTETNSEFFHLSLLCEDAEIFPDLLDKLRKTPAIERRNVEISRMMTRAGYEPVLLDMDEETQFIAANALMRRMAAFAHEDHFEGFRIASDYVDAKQYLKDSRLLDHSLNLLKEECHPKLLLNLKTQTENGN